jgi:hypothetical protein
MIRKDPSDRVHRFDDEGNMIVDGLDADIINREKGIGGVVAGQFKSKEERAESKEDKLVTEDLLRLTPLKENVLKTSDYDVNVAEPAVSDNDAVKIFSSQLPLLLFNCEPKLR